MGCVLTPNSSNPYLCVLLSALILTLFISLEWLVAQPGLHIYHCKDPYVYMQHLPPSFATYWAPVSFFEV